MRIQQPLLMAAVLWSPGLAADNESPGYGANPEAGAFAEVNGIRMYYEICGHCQPALLMNADRGARSVAGGCRVQRQAALAPGG